MAQATTVDDIQNTAETNNSQPTVRHIPIFVEGRDEPILNKNININPENIQKPAPIINDTHNSIFDRVKNFPVRKPATNFEIPVTSVGGGIPVGPGVVPGMRAESPARTIPIKVEHIQTRPRASKSPSPATATTGATVLNNISPKTVNNVLNNQSNENSRSRSPSPMPPKPPMDSITKIQQIQKEILELMDHVEKFKGTRKDKDYLYLDEMLTQNLLKLDTIDTEGKDNIKAARKEAINCINKCIAVLEAKVEQSEKDSPKIPNSGAETICSNVNIEQSNPIQLSDKSSTGINEKSKQSQENSVNSGNDKSS